MRVKFIDIWRGLAILGMVVFHFFYDLNLFGYADLEMFAGWWLVYARVIQISFLLLVGISTHIILSKLDYEAFLKKQWYRFLKVGAGALLVSVATWIVFRDQHVFFGILHLIAFSIVVLTLLSRVNRWGVFMLALLILAGAGHVAEISNPFFVWVGAQGSSFMTLDYFPVFPWLSVPLLGFVFAPGIVRFTKSFDLSLDWLTYMGRKSLIIYLLHQPLLFSIFYLVETLA